MAKTSSAPTEPTPVALVGPVPTPVVITSDLDKIRRAQLEKELMGIRAKLRWTHLTEGARQELTMRESIIEQELKNG